MGHTSLEKHEPLNSPSVPAGEGDYFVAPSLKINSK